MKWLGHQTGIRTVYDRRIKKNILVKIIIIILYNTHTKKIYMKHSV